MIDEATAIAALTTALDVTPEQMADLLEAVPLSAIYDEARSEARIGHPDAEPAIAQIIEAARILLAIDLADLDDDRQYPDEPTSKDRQL